MFFRVVLNIGLVFSISVFMSGCAEGYKHAYKVNKRTNKRYGSIHYGSPSFDKLQKEAPSQRTKYILLTTAKFDKDANTILTKTIDPLKDKEVKLKIDEAWAKNKRKMIAKAKKDGNYNANYVKFLKTMQKGMYKPYKVIRDVPLYIKEATISSLYKSKIGNDAMMYLQELTFLFVPLKDKSSLQLHEELVKEFDSVLVKNGWSKVVKFAKVIYTDVISDEKETLARYKEILKNTSVEDKQRIAYINKEIKQTENRIKNAEKMLKQENEKNAYESSTVSYSYRYKNNQGISYFKNDSILISIYASLTDVSVRIIKTEYKKK